MRVKIFTILLFILLSAYKIYCKESSKGIASNLPVLQEKRYNVVLNGNQNKNKLNQSNNKKNEINGLDSITRQIAKVEMQMKEYDDLYIKVKALTFLEGSIESEINTEEIKEKMIETELYNLKKDLDVESIKKLTTEQKIKVKVLKTKIEYLKMRSEHLNLLKDYLKNRLDQTRSLKHDFEDKISETDISLLESKREKLEKEKTDYMKNI